MSQAGTASGAPGGGGAVVETLTGNTGVATAVANNINVVGTGAVTTTGSGSTLTISIAGDGVVWIDQATSTVMVAGNGYFATAAIALTLPASPSQGNTVIVDCDTAGAVVITANTGQTIRFGTATSSVAGTATSTAQGDSMTLTYRAADTTWHGRALQGNWTPA